MESGIIRITSYYTTYKTYTNSNIIKGDRFVSIMIISNSYTFIFSLLSYLIVNLLR